MALATAAIGNGGQLWQPHVFLRLETPEGRVLREARSRAVEVGVSGATLQYLKDAMRGVVHGEHGTGRAAQVWGVQVAGKTGTAQNPHGEDHAWFVAFAPVDEPRVALAVIVENSGHGGAVAAPIARRILTAFFELDREPSAPKQVAAGIEDTGAGLEGF
jgi:cell division protein FtsI/penicillin-binding protein 2